MNHLRDSSTEAFLTPESCEKKSIRPLQTFEDSHSRIFSSEFSSHCLLCQKLI